ncbi:hypothetical protein COV24_01905 [candidate division WWE3 bacterium CG10_big_fil_rev_8_21_14_0_10_32_10]|uniref:Phosphoglycerate kinase n=1 Tax=candidate division WWE3 bacterium CG10_big_fil_rev_8_21_14_0_10_32_10 TaxID=1975090 RepID=A0A2H0RB17_UNCKA|nr:MAG: hypothetical protein COV24_01905 [candidate division WWE3 bacterium CG10_big_fil_rev_8_21_14_0_10_32_10]
MHKLNDIQNSHVFLRADMDVPLDKRKVEDDYRIKRCIETLVELISNGNKVAIFTKLGRPEKQDPDLSTKNILPTLRELLKKDILFIKNIYELELMHKTKEQIFLFENTRFFDWEENVDTKTSHKIATYFDYYVDEAFAMSHREETTNFIIPQKIGDIALGKNYVEEIDTLFKIRKGDFERPAYFILGGAKAETKIPMVSKLVSTFDKFLIGGKLVVESKKEFSNFKEKVVFGNLEKHGFDITDSATQDFINYIEKAKTVVWNGPTGMFELKEYKKSTEEIVKALEKTKALTIAGGGDTISAINKFGDIEKFSFVSTGGGAMFSYLAGNKTNIEKVEEIITNPK